MEASLAYGMGIYANWFLSIYCMLTARESDIVNNTVVISKRAIDEFRCDGNCIGTVRHSRFERLLNRKINSGHDIFLIGPVLYGAPTPSLIDKSFQGIPYNLVIKTYKYTHQRECRIIGSQPVEWSLKPDEKNPGRKIDEHGHAERTRRPSIQCDEPSRSVFNP